MPDNDARTIRVLVADDDPTILRLVETALPLAAPDIEIVGTAVDASELEESVQRLQPDIVMVDNHFDAESGVELGRALGELRPAPVLLLWTGTTSSELRESASEAGFSSVVEKSADLEGLAATIRQAVGG